MIEDKILIVEDEEGWIDNYQRWLKHESFNIDIAPSSAEAIEKLRTTYYALIILDLSLDPNNPLNRDSIQIQEYLKKHPEGTFYIVVSAVADRDDVKRACLQYKALDVFFKDQFEDQINFKNAIKIGIEKSRKQRPDFKKLSYQKMMGIEEPHIFEDKMLKTLKPKDGARGYLYFMEKLLDSVSPIELHKTRNKVTIINDQFVFALYWSRSLGSSISICLTNDNIDEKIKKEAMLNWLGWDNGKEWKLVKYREIKGYIHLENNLLPDDFILPTLE